MSEEKKYLLTKRDVRSLHKLMGRVDDNPASSRTVYMLNLFLECHEYHERTCHNADNYPMAFSCSACEYVVEADLYAEEFAYCPNCGAKVVKE